jgi:hypothetical protein
MSKPEVDDWVDATQPTRVANNVVRQALERLLESIEPRPRITEREIAVPLHLLDQVGEVRPSQPIIA